METRPPWQTSERHAEPIASAARLLGDLRKLYGRPQPPAVTDPFQQVLFENVAYLAAEKFV